MIWDHPKLLFLLSLLPVFIWWHQTRKHPSIAHPYTHKLSKLKNKKTEILSKLSQYLLYLCIGLIIIAIAGPKTLTGTQKRQSSGIDIVLILDTSLSMAAEDLTPNRLIVAKNTIKKFIEKRKNDRIALLSFGEDVFTLSPLTMDHSMPINELRSVPLGSSGYGTAIGLAIASGVNRLKNSNAKSKIIILLTDGENTMGTITPQLASDLARKRNIKVYTIGVGKRTSKPIYVYDPVTGARGKAKEVDEATLKEIAAATSAKFFRATNTKDLEAIYDEIDTLEKSKIETNQYWESEKQFPKLLALATLGLIIAITLSSTLGATLP